MFRPPAYRMLESEPLFNLLTHIFDEVGSCSPDLAGRLGRQGNLFCCLCLGLGYDIRR